MKRTTIQRQAKVFFLWPMIVLMTQSLAGEAQQVNYREQVQPILSKNCYPCHGPDGNHREAELRFDVDEEHTRELINPGQAGDSEFLRRLNSQDEQEVMPPPDSGKSLTPTELEILQRWVQQGADWQKHWAFEPLQPVVPPAMNSQWCQNAIDQFILQRMHGAGLSPAPPADKRILMRRVYFDLIGKQPTWQQLQSFLNDASPEAYERVVDELLASPHFGEQMAVSWLDAARYADTNGYQNDFLRSMWPWRDWAINAFNKNMPYDQFIKEQLAGDLLPNPTTEQLIATGFNRNNRSVTEGGSIEEEWRIENAIDRVETTAATFMGLTLGCARCHDHKYDPVSQREFYQFFAFFNNIDEKGVYNEQRGNTEPLLKVPTPEQLAQLATLQGQIDSLRMELDASPDQPNHSLERWRNELPVAANRDWPQPVYTFAPGDGETWKEWGPSARGIELTGQNDALPKPEFKTELTFERDVPFSWSVWVKGDSRGSVFGKMDEGNQYRGIDGIVLEDGRLKIHLIHSWKVNAVAVLTKAPLPAEGWVALTVTYDGRSKAEGYKIYIDGKLVPTEIDIDTLSESIQTEVPFKIGQRHRSEHFQGTLSDFRWYTVELAAADVLDLWKRSLLQQIDSDATVAEGEATEVTEAVKVTQRYLQLLEKQDLRQRLAGLQAERDKLEQSQQTTMIMRDRAEYRETYLLRRGQYDLPDTSEALWPAMPAVLPPLPSDAPANRLGLALWMTDPKNPLVSRVAVNRVWFQFFGRGIVDSVDNFGVQGTPPTHPQLLDWLAQDFQKSGWDVKRLIKQMVMSATYRHSSEASTTHLAADPGNHFYTRGTRQRLTGEMLRDNALFVSGLLVEKLGGPSVAPYQPEGLWEELAGGASNGPYVMSQGDDLFRRSLYTYRKRTVSHPTVATFDAPSWEICQIKRATTNTPLQALALLNDVTYVEAARHLARQMLSEPSEVPEQVIAAGFRTAILREPTERELSVLVQGWNNYWEFYRDHPEAAQELLSIGATAEAALPDSAVDAARLAAYATTASVILNLDEFIVKE